MVTTTEAAGTVPTGNPTAGESSFVSFQSVCFPGSLPATAPTPAITNAPTTRASAGERHFTA